MFVECNYTMYINGILDITDKVVSVEDIENGTLQPLSKLLAKFADKDVAITISYTKDMKQE